MSESIDNLVLEHLRAIRADLGLLKDDVREVKFRLTALERGQARSHSDYAELYGDHARQQAAIDRLAERVERVERRLDLETP